MSTHVLLTGATGFIGKVVLAMLLRERERLGIDKIHLVIRGKATRSASKRFAKAIASSPCLRAAPADWRRYVDVVEGNLDQARFGMSEADYGHLQQEVTHIIHLAASVDFNLPIAEAARANISGSLNVLELAAGCPHLVRMVHTSTAYVTPHRVGTIDPALVPLPFNPASTFADIERGVADQATLLASTGHPNTYTFTKCVAEHLLHQRRGAVPLTIVRPSIVSASWRFPERGWVDSSAAYTGFVALYFSGRLDVLLADPKVRLDVVPADIVASRLISSAFAEGAAAFEIKHSAATVDRACRIDELGSIVRSVRRDLPTGARASRLRMRPDGLAFRMDDLLSHKLVFAAGDAAMRLAGNKRGRFKLTGLRKAIETVQRDFGYFTQNEFDFRDSEADASSAFDPSDYHTAVSEAAYKHLLRLDERAVDIGGRKHHLGEGALPWAVNQPAANAHHRVIGAALRTALGKVADRVTYDRRSFDEVIAKAREGYAVALVPSHRSYLDFLLCSYLLFDQDLGITLPRIVARREFGQMPMLSALLKKAGAAYGNGTVGQIDPQLSAFVRERVHHAEPFEFFIEGRRSRTREFLPPKRGVLRAIQASGAPCLIVPLAIAYDRIPEEASLAAELSGGTWREPSASRLLQWTQRALSGGEDLGRIHMRAGAPILLEPSSDVVQISRDIVRELQGAMACSTFHLRAFLANHPEIVSSEASLRRLLESRGVTVIESALHHAPHETPASVSASYEGQFRAWFCEDALQLWPDDAVLKQYALEHCYQPPNHVRQLRHVREDEESAKIATALFGPLRGVYRAVEQWAGGARGRDHDVNVVANAVNCRYLPWVELALRALAAAPRPAARRPSIAPPSNGSRKSNAPPAMVRA